MYKNDHNYSLSETLDVFMKKMWTCGDLFRLAGTECIDEISFE